MASDYHFETYTRSPSHSKGMRAELWLTSGRCNIGEPVWEGLGRPTHIQLFYDRANAAIKLAAVKPGYGGLRALRASERRALQLSIKDESFKMPLGTYVPIGSNIFVHESKNR